LEWLEDRVLPSGLFSDPIISTNSGGGTTAIVTGNFIKGDAQPDVVALNGGSGHDLTLQLFVSDAQGHLTPRGAPIDTGSADVVSGAVSGIFTGDGDLDVAFVAWSPTGGGQVEVWLGHGDGTFTQAPSSPITAGIPSGLVADNFNGHLDLAFADQGWVTVLLNDGSGTFTPKTMVTGLGGGLAIAVAAGDFNGDGSKDLAVTEVEGNYVNVFLGDGLGDFQAVTGGPFESYAAGGPDCLQVGEFDSDKFPDVAVVGNNGAGEGEVTVLKGDGTGKITQQPATDLGPNGATDVVVADFSGNHRPDLFFTQVSQPPRVLLCNGSDGFTDGGPVNVAAQYFPHANPIVAVADFNGDNKPDVVLVDYQGNLDVLLNQSGLVPTPTSVTLSSSANPSMAGQPITLTATIVPQVATGIPIGGTVTFTEGSATLGSVQVNNGQATLTTALPGAGSIVANYSGDSNYVGSMSNTVAQTIRAPNTFVWSGAGPDNRWTDAGNWNGGVAPLPGDQLVFPGGRPHQANVNDYPEGTFFYSLTFPATKYSGGNYQISGNGISLGAGGITDQAAGSSSVLGVAIALTGSACPVALGTTTSNLELDGDVSDAAGSNAGIVKSGPGQLKLIGNNTYLGLTDITGGEVEVSNSAAMGTGLVRVRAGATLRLFPLAGMPPLVVANSLQLAGVLVGDGTGYNTWAGHITLATATATIDSEATNVPLLVSGTITGNITGNSGFVKTGPGILALSGNNAYRGITDVKKGTLELLSSAALGSTASKAVVERSATLELAGGIQVVQELFFLDERAQLISLSGNNTWSGTIHLPAQAARFAEDLSLEVDAGQLLIAGQLLDPRAGAGRPARLRKNGPGTLVLTSANHISQGAVVAGGILEVQNAKALGGVIGGTIYVRDGATLALNAGASSGMGFIQSLELAGSGSANTGALLNVAGTNSWLGTIKLDNHVYVGADTSSTLLLGGDPRLGRNIRGAGGLAVAGTGTVRLVTSSSYTGPTLVLGGILYVSANTLGSSSVTVAAGGTLKLHGSRPYTQSLTLLDHSQLVVQENSTWSGDVTIAGTVQVTVTSGMTLQLVGFVMDTSAARLDVSGGGNLVLAPGISSPGTFTTILAPSPADVGQIQLDAGTLALSAWYLDSLIVSLAGGFVPPIGAQFTIVHNLSSSAIIGTFAGLPEGSTFAVGDLTFQITYAGGGGNDVVVTRVA
jgi:autotransporter-associated beta strand protein